MSLKTSLVKTMQRISKIIDNILDEILNTFKKPIVLFSLTVLLITTITASAWKLHDHLIETEKQKLANIQYRQSIYCDYFFSQFTISVFENYPNIPIVLVRNMSLKCKADMILRIYTTKILCNESYIQNLSLSFLNLIWSESFNQLLDNEEFKVFILEHCRKLSTALYLMY